MTSCSRCWMKPTSRGTPAPRVPQTQRPGAAGTSKPNGQALQHPTFAATRRPQEVLVHLLCSCVSWASSTTHNEKMASYAAEQASGAACWSPYIQAQCFRPTWAPRLPLLCSAARHHAGQAAPTVFGCPACGSGPGCGVSCPARTTHVPPPQLGGRWRDQ